MKIIKKHYKKSDSWLYCCFVAHDGFGLKPRLKISFIVEVGFTFISFSLFGDLKYIDVELKR